MLKVFRRYVTHRAMSRGVLVFVLAPGRSADPQAARKRPASGRREGLRMAFYLRQRSTAGRSG